MSSQPRYARLTGSDEPEVPGGGVPLPGAFHDVLYYLLNNGRSALEEVLAKVVRDSIGDALHGNRVRLVWGTWGALARDMLDQLEERGLVAHRGETWMLTGIVQSGGRYTILFYPGGVRRMRLTVRSKEEHEAREQLAKARSRMTDYRQQLIAWGLYSGKVKTSLERHIRSLTWEEAEVKDEEEETILPPVGFEWQEDRSRGSLTRFAEKYLQNQYPRWVGTGEVSRQYNKMNPHGKPIQVSQPFERLMTLVKWGLAERKNDEDQEYRGRPKALFRWIQ